MKNKSTVGGAEWTLPIPEAGRRYYKAGKNRSYAMARDGTMPTITIGPRRKLALVRAIEKQLEGGE
jgi:hypothetical protein